MPNQQIKYKYIYYVLETRQIASRRRIMVYNKNKSTRTRVGFIKIKI